MSAPLKLAIAGLGRMGQIHLIHAVELQRETRACTLAAVAEPRRDRAKHLLEELEIDVPIFDTVDDLAKSDVCKATMVVTPTDMHAAHARTLLNAGHRVLLEKPLTGTADGDRALCDELDRTHPEGVMLAFQRRRDPALAYARDLAQSGLIGRVFRIFSALEDSGPAPNGYNSPGILSDMAIHNVDEILWLAGRLPRRALAIGSRLHGYRLTTCVEDFDDAMLCMWFEGDLAARVEVSRNHVSGYRNETLIYGEKGQIHIGRFEQKPLEVIVESYGPRGKEHSLDYKTFQSRDYRKPLPEFAERFGPAYKTELVEFIEKCRAGKPFATTHRDAWRAQTVIAAGMKAVFTESNGAPCEF